ncbi:MAG: phage tail protein [Lachnospiraceae bacterium]|nr:phage tail protein [Lachnospiraceae bacterium]
MENTYFTIVTDSGTKKMFDALNEEKKVSIAEFAVGDGGGEAYSPTKEMEALKNEVWRGSVKSCYVSEESENLLITESVIPSDVGGFTIREMGIFDTEGTLIAICNTPETQKVRIADGVVHEMTLSMEIALSNTDSVELIVDPAVVTATKKDVERLGSSLEKKIEEEYNATYRQATGYTDTKIADLINGAPSTLDTLGEIAQAMQDNESVVEALDKAMGSKASQAELDGHTGNSTIHITASERTGWNNKLDKTGDASNTTAAFTQASTLADIKTGEKISAIMGKVSKAIATLISHVAEKATGSKYGHVKLSDTYKSAVSKGDAANGVGASQKALADAYSALNCNLGNCTFSVQSDGAYVTYTPEGGADTVTKKLGSMDLDLKSTECIKESAHRGIAYFDVSGIDSITVTVQQTKTSTTSLYICGGDDTKFDIYNEKINGTVLGTLTAGVTATIDCSEYDYVAMELYDRGLSINQRYLSVGNYIVSGAQCVKIE